MAKRISQAAQVAQVVAVSDAPAKPTHPRVSIAMRYLEVSLQQRTMNIRYRELYTEMYHLKQAMKEGSNMLEALAQDAEGTIR